jgi:hypothetical protein
MAFEKFMRPAISDIDEYTAKGMLLRGSTEPTGILHDRCMYFRGFVGAGLALEFLLQTPQTGLNSHLPEAHGVFP